MSLNQSNNSSINKIGIDLTSLDPNYYGGIDVYCNGIIEGAKKNKNINFIIFINKTYFEKRKFKNSRNVKFFFFENNIFKRLIFKIYNRLFPIFSIFLFHFKYKFDYYLRNFIFSEFKDAVEKHVNYLICPDTFIKNYNHNIKVSANIHDLNHLEFPKQFSFFENLKREYLYYNTIKYSDNLVLSSYGIKKTVLDNYILSIKDLEKKISVISEGISSKPQFKLKKIPYDNFFLFPSQLWLHKNHHLVIKGFIKFNRLYNNKYNLICTGVKNNKKILNLIDHSHNCYHLGVVNKDTLYNLYYKSIATICPSIAEESSLPMLEAFMFKSTVIASDNLSNLEKKKDFNFIIFKKKQINSFYKSLISVCKKNKYYSESKLKNFNSLKKFTWYLLVKKWILQLI